MIKQSFGKTGYEVSRLGFGGAPIGYLGADQSSVSEILNLMLDNGVNLLDTAAAYSGSEEMIAKTVGHRREQFVLVSKCGGKLPDIDEPAWSPALITKTVERSLKNLQTDHLDVMLLHSCDRNTLENGGVIEPLVKARDAGKIRFLGYSGDNETAAAAAEMSEIAVIEMSMNIADQINIDKVLPLCRKNQIGVLAKRPIANAAWKDISNQPGLYKTYAKTYTDRLTQMKLTPAQLGFPDDAWPEIAIRFTLSQAGVNTAIVGTTHPANARANLALANKGPLSDEVIKKIRDAFKQADPNGTWTGQT